MDLYLQNKRVIVTGGSKGIGKGIAKGFLQEGAKVAIIARGKEALEKAMIDMPGVYTVQGDMMSQEDRENSFRRAVELLGGVDILINNVGGSNGSTVEETPLSLFEDAMNLNYYSAVHFSQLALPYMKEQKDGAIINISSIYGRESGGKATYNNAKAAMISFTKALANEVIKDGIRVNGVAPGSVLHPTGNWQKRVKADPEQMKKFVEEHIPAGRFGTVEEIADVVVFLASKRANWVVGATLNVDGGQSKMNF